MQNKFLLQEGEGTLPSEWQLGAVSCWVLLNKLNGLGKAGAISKVPFHATILDVQCVLIRVE